MSNSELRIQRCGGRDLTQNIPSPSKLTNNSSYTSTISCVVVLNYNLDSLDCKYAFFFLSIAAISIIADSQINYSHGESTV